MSLWKVIVMVALLSMLLFVGMLFFALYPAISNVSAHEELKPFIGKDLKLRRDVYVYRTDEGHYRFEPLLMSSDRSSPYERRFVLPEGSTIRIEKFKTFSKSWKNHHTELYAIGSAVTSTGRKLKFEYDWGNVERPGNLKLAPWQDSTDRQVFYANKKK